MTRESLVRFHGMFSKAFEVLSAVLQGIIPGPVLQRIY
jgi:hypothetical protein